MDKDLKDKLQNTINSIRNKTRFMPKIGIILGSGLGAISLKAEVQASFDYSQLPNFIVPSVEGHKGELVLGRLGNAEVAILNGRAHYYEGRSFEEVNYPVYLLKELGAEYLIITSAVGSMRGKIHPGDCVVIKDHINFIGENPLRNTRGSVSADNFVDLSSCYDKELRVNAVNIAGKNRIKAREAVYFAVSGPTYETPAEVKAFSMLGGDVIGMSVVPEVLAGKKAGLKILALSYVSNMASGLGKNTVSHKEVVSSGKTAAEDIFKIISGVTEYVYRKKE